MNVVPKEGEQRADDGVTKSRHKKLPLQHGNHAVRRKGRRRDQSSQSIQAVGEVHCIDGAKNDKRGNRDIKPTQIKFDGVARQCQTVRVQTKIQNE